MGHCIIKKIHIAHFRSIVNETINVSDFNIFVGMNDVGKSNVLKALDMFFNYTPEKYKFEDNFSLIYNQPRKKAKEIIIELTLELPDNFIDKGEFVWRRVWRSTGLAEDKFNRPFLPHSKGEFFFRNTHFEYVPAVKSREYFRDLLSKLYATMLGSTSGKLTAANKKYTGVLRDMTKELTDITHRNLNLNSYLQMPDDMSLVFRDLLIQTIDGKNEIPLTYRGDGIQARYIPSVLKYIYNLSIRDLPKSSIRSTTIWAYEEPENGVELKACYDLAAELLKDSSEIQIFITTHSPAFYELKGKICVTLFYTRRETMGSQYSTDVHLKEIDAEMGLLPLIEPYLSEIKQKVETLNAEKESMAKRLNDLKSKVDKIIIFTEGETDEMYLKEAVKHTDFANKIIFNPNVDKFGDGELDKIYKEISKSSDENIKICVYDRDATIFNDKFERASNNVFRFNIPVPAHRKADEKISIEHYFTDDQIMTSDENGHRLYMAKEFDQQGRAIDGSELFTPYTIFKQKDYYPLRILDGSENKLTVQPLGSENNIALSKKRFAQYVVEKHSNFDFGFANFSPIIGLLTEIIEFTKR